MSKNGIILVIKASDIDVSSLPEYKRDIISRPFKDAEFQRSLRLLTDGKLEEARFILEDLAFRSPDDPNVLYDLGMCYSDLGDLDIAIDTLNRCVPSQVRVDEV